MTGVYLCKLTTAAFECSIHAVSYTHLDVYKRQEYGSNTINQAVLDSQSNLKCPEIVNINKSGIRTPFFIKEF